MSATCACNLVQPKVELVGVLTVDPARACGFHVCILGDGLYPAYFSKHPADYNWMYKPVGGRILSGPDTPGNIRPHICGRI